MKIEIPDFTTMSDPDFLAARRRVRDQYFEMDPGNSGRTGLGALRDAMDEEFDRRARAAWTAEASGDGKPAAAGGNPAVSSDNRSND